MHSILNKVKTILSDKDNNEIAGKSSISFLLKIGSFITNYGLVFICTYYSGAKGWGLFAICFSLTRLVGLFCTFGFPNSIVKFFADHELDRRYFLKIAMLITVPFSVIVSLIIYSFSEEVASIFNEVDDDLIIAIKLSSAAIVPFAISLVVSGFYRAIKNMSQYHFFETIGRQLFTLIIYLIWVQVQNEDYVSIFSFLIANWILMLIGLVLIAVQLRKNAGGNNTVTVRQILSVSTSLHISKFVNYGVISSTVFILGIFVDRSLVGIYDACYRVANFSSIALLAVNSISASKFAEFSSPQNINKLRKNLRFSGAIVFWVSIPVILFIAIFSYWILGIFGDSFIYGQIALLILLAGQLVNNLAGSVGMMMQMTGMHIQFRNINIAVFVMIIVLNFGMIPILGINGAAFAVTLGLIIKNFTSVYLVYRSKGISSFYLPSIKFFK
ncbi:Membrane protein involved in the export of O-antigen and teichoic acid [Ekhidna lutea]|uniref:Membrane protein involved in the export of O-antigen and teichoic acid n=1 Tax=Ekhidna lutea TaxID=447679 RepID=A0A239FFY9_EKHLU|nr:oligosaccharide flippase family protein [Ekhidna lutea]SNS55717.1 Membrane protein involved in the export of O-antigen and teichoic acid [Ekhidna lutea]